VAASDKIALITGASRGFGHAMALEFGKSMQVVALARTQGGLTELDDQLKQETGRGATLVPFDLAGPDQAFAQLGQTLFERFKKLDVLALNAATLGPLSPVAHTMEKDLQAVMNVNFTANMRLLRHLDPLLRAASQPKIIFITCGTTSRAHNAYWGAYAASKKALEQLALTYKEETEKAGFQVEVIDPGPMATALRRSAFPGEDQSKVKTPAEVVAGLIAKAKAA
jgi:NAD(P)-dependent dehydrogenase (short-subunit alcohol dehydrogenase family)